MTLGCRAGEDALEGNPHRRGQAHVLEHVPGPDAAVHDLEAPDLDAVDSRMEGTIRVAVEVRREGAQVLGKPLDPEVAWLDQVPVGVSQLLDPGARLARRAHPPLRWALAHRVSGCQSSDLIG